MKPGDVVVIGAFDEVPEHWFQVEESWSAPTEWSGLIVSAWSASGPLARNFLGLVDGSPEHCAA
jgi:hypothetical protein